YYLESQGSPQQYLSLQNVVSSLFPTGLNCQSTTAGGLQQCQQASQEASNINAQQLSSSLTGTSGATASAPVPQPNTYANTIISGYVLIPYKIVYTLGSGITSPNQYSDGGYLQGEVVAGTPPPNYYHCVQYGGGGLKGGSAHCLREEPGCQYPIPGGLTGTQAQGSVVQYAYGRVNLPKSNSLNNTIEGGGTYVQFTPGSNYYIANISDAAMITIPRIDTQTFTNRLFGAMYINSTITPSSINPNGYTSPMVMNAVQALNYRENFFVQQSAQSTASYPAFSLQQSQAADPSTLSKVGPTCGGSCPSQYYYSTNPTKIFQGNTQLSYANYSQLSYLPLFELVQQASEVYYAGLSTPENSLLGYNRLIYTLVDRFNNVIHMPLGVDLANLAQISLSPVVTVNALNANETTIDVTGMATYTNSIGTYPLPAGSPIYIYYDTNINFFSPTLTPGQSPSEYYQYALQCAFGTAAGGCPLADPLATYTQGSTAPTIADTITFHTNYGKNPGECAPEPQSLLTTAPADQCNIYGNFGLPSTTFDANIGSYQYCDPLTSTGNGILTSQMGLAAIVKTDSAGSFNSVINVCGTGAHKVVAQFYGSPGPEPFPVTQTPLTQSAGQYESFSSSTSPAPTVGTNLEYGYVFSPNTVAYNLQVGSYALGFGSVSVVSIAAIIAIMLAAIAFARRSASRTAPRGRARLNKKR
ncbi:MAG: hypothetical protein KGH58_03160, partial [Candidatus Micrarchaeota archaeon]|nr:hypothetical protein [Candidatus Micrarchaeota archaeon]